MIGTSLSHYRITEKLGAGGMNLSRQVAIKVLPDEFAQDAERLARFQREAKMLISLNHVDILLSSTTSSPREASKCLKETRP